MKTKIFVLLICASVITACSSNRNTLEGTTDNTDKPLPKTATGFASQRDGSSFDKAIIIDEKTERAGLDAENTQLITLFPGSKRVSQRYEIYKDKQHEIVNITTTDGRETQVYFDVSSYFGKQ
ncbi:hypothetical protein ACFQZS_00135 [Mucilaginibacter calamicampi]|uniref:Lipoprotein n=1 Tax=Mucilaginibacter calamicampi TaxID=1302352 RepID=A0ABW2YS24_9SPHI